MTLWKKINYGILLENVLLSELIEAFVWITVAIRIILGPQNPW